MNWYTNKVIPKKPTFTEIVSNKFEMGVLD